MNTSAAVSVTVINTEPILLREFYGLPREKPKYGCKKCSHIWKSINHECIFPIKYSPFSFFVCWQFMVPVKHAVISDLLSALFLIDLSESDFCRTA